MKIPYRTLEEYLPVDMERLRPKGSYAALMEKRTHTIDALICQYGKIPDDLLKRRSCPTCGSSGYRTALEKDHLTLVQCNDCQLVFVSPVFDEHHYREAYQSAEYAEVVEKLGFESHPYRVERFGKERVELLRQHAGHLSGPLRYLDIGCSTGFVVEAAQQAGWVSQGIDLNRSAVEFGKERGLHLEPGDLFDFKFAPASFELITAFDVLEHVLDPAKILGKIRELLVPGGLSFLYVPNWDSASRVWMGKDAHFIWPTHHLTYYTPTTLQVFVRRHGFEVVYLATEGLDVFDYIWKREEVDGIQMGEFKELANSIQFFVNAGGWGKNLRCMIRKV